MTLPYQGEPWDIEDARSFRAGGAESLPRDSHHRAGAQR
jgi:hypothetical protein